MSRYIDADALMQKLDIKADCKECNSVDHYFGCLKSLDFVNACEAINEAPSIDIPQWIPCSERLPSDSGEYLVTAGTHDAFVDVLYYGKPLMPNRKVKGKCFYKADDEWGDIVDDDVIAWMPLPKPYGEREGE